MNLSGNQSIDCSVASCKFNESGRCTLNGIQVASLSNVVDIPEESMCQSFERKEY